MNLGCFSSDTWSFSDEIAPVLQHISFELSCNIWINDLKSFLFSSLLVQFPPPPPFIVTDSSPNYL